MAAPTSQPHYHTSDSPCLEAIPAVPLWLGRIGEVYAAGEMKGQPLPTVPVDGGWYRCTEREAYYVHDHGVRFVSHYPRDEKAGCPT
jgi:hypothetical protein